jgi:hypothetical protein
MSPKKKTPSIIWMTLFAAYKVFFNTRQRGEEERIRTAENICEMGLVT